MSCGSRWKACNARRRDSLSLWSISWHATIRSRRFGGPSTDPAALRNGAGIFAVRDGGDAARGQHGARRTDVRAVAPCRSIARTIANAVPGDKIIVGPGMYSDFLDNDGVFNGPGEEPMSGIYIEKPLQIVSALGASNTLVRVSSPVFVSRSSNVTHGKLGIGFTILTGSTNSPSVTSASIHFKRARDPDTSKRRAYSDRRSVSCLHATFTTPTISFSLCNRPERNRSIIGVSAASTRAARISLLFIFSQVTYVSVTIHDVNGRTVTRPPMKHRCCPTGTLIARIRTFFTSLKGGTRNGAARSRIAAACLAFP